MPKPKLKAPFPAIGGKSRVAELVWGQIGDVRNYIETNCFSAAVLLARPHPGRIETINDINGFVANFWRAIKADPEKVAEYADNPVNEADLHARHLWLMFSQTSIEFREKIKTDPEYYDAKIAGWWCWGQCCWIGSGWCSDQGVEWKQRPDMEGLDRGVNKLAQKLPHIGASHPTDSTGRGVNGAAAPTQKRPLLSPGNSQHGHGVHARPQLADAYSRGRGVNGNDHAGTCAERRAWLIDWFGRLQDRLRNVRVCCGDWSRVCSSPSVTTRLGTTGIFIDPPYALNTARMHAWVSFLDGKIEQPPEKAAATNRDGNLYGSDSDDVDLMVAKVHIFCRERGSDPEVRIVLCGYAGEHDALEEIGWEAVSWKASGYGNRTDSGKSNNAKERLWFSPHCCKPERVTRPMFSIWVKQKELV